MKYIILLASMLMVTSCMAEDEPSNITDKLSARFSASGISSDTAINIFFEKIKFYVETDDSKSLAKLIAYPMQVRGLDGKEVLQITNDSDFVMHYDAIINERVKHTIICSTFEELSATYKGVIIGDGAVWFTETKDKDEDPWVMLIIRINNSHKDKKLWYKSDECEL
jgi:hypothetical protein